MHFGSKLTQSVKESNTLYFTFDASGAPMAVLYNGTSYYYVTNIQGDVIAILDTSGTAVVEYAYDAWGNIILTTGSMADTLGYWNPCRYRGYVYDNETQLYYLQSRYYNPEVGRFINADALVATGQGLLGNNMFAYCGNNPVNLLDPTGTISWALFGDNNPNMLAGFGGGGNSYTSGGVSARGHYISMKEFLDTNSTEVVFENLKKNGVAYYKGTLVISAPLLFDKSALSLGVIIMDDYFEGVNASEFEKILKHEYGHIEQYRQIGLVDYLGLIAIPSLAGAGVGMVYPDYKKYYYDQPWERSANYYGNVNSSHTPFINALASAYWLWTISISMLTPF